MKPADIRTDYQKGQLDEAHASTNPFKQFELWFEEAQQQNVIEVNAMSLATVNATHRPSVRTVLLKDVDERGFTFFTNYLSRKGQDIASTPYASLLFFWASLERQVRIEGRIEKISAEESDHYFQSRPLGSRIGAWASPQSQVISSREELITKEHEISDLYGEQPPRPEHWGGYRVVPDRFEFWQGRSNRLHDRLEYRQESDTWRIVRLAP